MVVGETHHLRKPPYRRFFGSAELHQEPSNVPEAMMQAFELTDDNMQCSGGCFSGEAASGIWPFWGVLAENPLEFPNL